MRLAIALGGTDYGRSGIGVYTRAIMPRIQQALEKSGDDLVVFGTSNDIRAYADVLGQAEHCIVPAAFTSPGPNAFFHLIAASGMLSRQGVSTLLLPAANRRILLNSTIPTVAVVHDLAQLHVARKYDPLRMGYFRHAVLPLVRRATRIVAISATTQKDLTRAFDWPATRIAIVPNGVDAAKFSPPLPNDPRISRAIQKLGLKSPYILYLGRLEHPGKNHLRLIESFATSRAATNHSLVLAGADWGAEQIIRETIAKFQIEARVRMTGFVPDELVPGLVAGADAVAMVGLHEGFGLPALEALAAGRPLFVANAGALPEVTAGLAAMCNPFDCSSIRQALERALTDTQFRQNALECGPKHAQRYGWDQTASALLEHCREINRPDA